MVILGHANGFRHILGGPAATQLLRLAGDIFGLTGTQAERDQT